jgi:hypothetical protein
MIIKNLQYNFKKTIVVSYCIIVFKQCISSCTKIFTRNSCLAMKKKYINVLWTQDNVVYVNPCFVTPLRSNAKRSRVKPYAQ